MPEKSETPADKSPDIPLESAAPKEEAAKKTASVDPVQKAAKAGESVIEGSDADSQGSRERTIPDPPWKGPEVALTNGLVLEFVAGVSPEEAALAVCSTDWAGGRGPLNEHVFEAVGVPIEELDNFTPPFTRWSNDRGTVLAVATVGGGEHTWSNTVRGLRAGLEAEMASGELESVWIGMLGTGFGGLSTLDGVRAVMQSLTTLRGRGRRFRVIYNFVDADRASKALGDLPSQRPEGWHFPPHMLAGEPHVQAALAHAKVIGGGTVGPRDVLEAVLAAETGHSEAFAELRNLLPGPGRTLPEPPSDPAGELSEGTTFTGAMAETLLGMPSYLRDDAPVIWGRDLIALALLSNDPGVEELARASGTSVEALRAQWLRFASRGSVHGKPESWRNWWTDARATTDRDGVIRSGYLAERVGVEDQLDVEGEAHAFANLICDQNVSPPLSIALLGDWGSGKSFFMDLVADGVESLSGTPGFCEKVAPIRFNAWHMSDANLWASLADRVFTELWAAIFPKEATPEAQEKFRAELAEARGAVHAASAEVDIARVQVRRAQEALDEARKKKALPTPRKALTKAAEALRLQGAVEDIVAVEEAYREFTDATKSTEQLLRASIQSPARRWALVSGGVTLLVFGLGVPALMRFLPDALDAQTQAEIIRALSQVGGTAGTLLAAVAGALGSGAGRIRRFRTGLETELALFEEKLAKEESGAREARDALEAARHGLRAAEGRVRQLEQRGVAYDAARVLSSFIEERANSEDYRARQGLISLVRSDFERLSIMMRDWKEAKKAGGPTGDQDSEEWRSVGKLVDRVVLYVDDLDRCSPDRVVEVLEAIHLLLALDLFVVVVAVDSRWLLRALDVHYAELLEVESPDDGRYRRSTPQNYLEKIFQIPYALAPMSEKGFKKYVGSLITDGSLSEREQQAEKLRREERLREEERRRRAEEARKRDAASASTEIGQGDEQSDDTDDTQDDGDEAVGSSGGAGSSSTTTSESGAEGDEGQVGTPGEKPSRESWGVKEAEGPRIVIITGNERSFIEGLGPLLPTPRQAKRLVNVFRLLKSQVPEAYMDDFEDPKGSGYRSALLLLAFLFGRPAFAGHVLRRLYEDEPPVDTSLADLIEAWKPKQAAESKTAEGRNGAADSASDVDDSVADPYRVSWSAQAEDVARVVRALAPDLTARECRVWVGRVARYSMVTGQTWHLWRSESKTDDPWSKSPM